MAVARALANDPAVLLADEPTGNLDSTTSVQIMGLFQELYEQGKTVMFKCDKHVTKQVFEPVLGAVAKAGATIAALGERPTDKQEVQP